MNALVRTASCGPAAYGAGRYPVTPDEYLIIARIRDTDFKDYQPVRTMLRWEVPIEAAYRKYRQGLNLPIPAYPPLPRQGLVADARQKRRMALSQAKIGPSQ